MKRKDLLYILGFILVFSIIVGIVIRKENPVTNSSTSEAPSIREEGTLMVINDNIYVHTISYAEGKMVLVVSGKEATLVDAGNDPGDQIAFMEIIEKSGIQLKNIIITHRHQDHIANIGAFKNEQVKVWDYNSTQDGQTIKMGDKTFKIIFTKGHHSNQHLSVEIVNDNILVAGDVIVTSVPSLLPYGGKLKDLKETLEMIKTKNYDLIIPGHGKVMDAQKTIDANLTYVVNLEKHVEKFIVDNPDLSLKDAIIMLQDQVKLGDCLEDISHLNLDEAEAMHRSVLKPVYNELRRK